MSGLIQSKSPGFKRCHSVKRQTNEANAFEICEAISLLRRQRRVWPLFCMKIYGQNKINIADLRSFRRF